MMDVSGVQIATGFRLLYQGKGPARLFHHVDADAWCETVIPRSRFKGSWDDGSLALKDWIDCAGAHLRGTVEAGQWVPFPVAEVDLDEQIANGEAGYPVLDDPAAGEQP